MSIIKVTEDIRKKTPLGAFFYNALKLETYGNILAWEDNANMTFCLRCIRKNMKTYTDKVEKIFMDYKKFQNRKKSRTDKEALRTNPLNAIKKSVYVALDEERSTNDEKFCRFTPTFQTLLTHVQRQNGVEESNRVVPDEEMELDTSFVPQANQSYIIIANEPINLDTVPSKEDKLPIVHANILKQPKEEKNLFPLEEEGWQSFNCEEGGSNIDAGSDMENMDPESPMLAFPLEDPVSSLLFMDPNKMFVKSVEEESQSVYTGTRGNMDLNSLNYENSLIDENLSAFNQFDVAEVELHDNQFHLLSEDEPTLSFSKHYMVTILNCNVPQRDDQPQNSIGGLKGSRS